MKNFINFLKNSSDFQSADLFMKKFAEYVIAEAQNLSMNEIEKITISTIEIFETGIMENLAPNWDEKDMQNFYDFRYMISVLQSSAYLKTFGENALERAENMIKETLTFWATYILELMSI